MVWLVAIALASPASGADGHRWPILGVIDGDTPRVRLPGLPAEFNPIGLRLAGVDAPELGRRARCPAEQLQAEMARLWLRRVLAGAVAVEFVDPRRDKYGGRVAARMIVDGVDIAAPMIAAGLARPHAGDHRAGWCATADGPDQPIRSRAIHGSSAPGARP